MFVGGIVGARLFYVIEYWDTRFQFDDWGATILAVLKFTEGGLVVYGSLIGATLAFAWFVRKHQLPALALADLIAPSLLAGLALGRIGCLLNGCCYGGESSSPWAVTFPRDSMPYIDQAANGRMWGLRLVGAENAPPEIESVQADSAGAAAGLEPGMKLTAINGQPVATRDEFASGVATTLMGGYGGTVVLETSEGASHTLRLDTFPERSLPVHPTQIYSAVNAGLLSWVLWSFYPLRRRDGQVTALMLTAYPIARFLLEIIRIDESAVFGTGLSISQNISLVILVGAAALWWYTSRRPQPLATFEPVLA
jgi:phosphatidylglycerol:prolipoprotein diacylglycerol transferase